MKPRPLGSEFQSAIAYERNDVKSNDGHQEFNSWYHIKMAIQTENAFCVLEIHKICDHCSTEFSVKVPIFRMLIHFENGTWDFKILPVSAFYVLLTVHLGIILVNNQLDAQFFFLYVYFNSLHVTSTPVLIIRRINCINTTSGMSLCVGDRLVCRSGRNSPTCILDGTYTEWHIPDVVLILLMMSTGLLETCRESK